jgi:hypothetical protein
VATEQTLICDWPLQQITHVNRMAPYKSHQHAPEFGIKYFKLLFQMLKLVVLAILIVPSIMASIEEQIAKALIAEKDTGKLEQTFRGLHKKHGTGSSADALADVASQGHPEIVATCLRAKQDPFFNDKMHVDGLVNSTLVRISQRTLGDPESFTKVITSFTPADVKPLVSIRNITLHRDDAIAVLRRVMDKSSELIIDTLPSWLASHGFDRNSCAYNVYQTAREGGLQYLASFATESVLEKALSIVKANEHYKAGPTVLCCGSQDYIPDALIDKLTGLLALVKARNALVKAALPFMPTVLLNLLAEYTTYEAIDSPTSNPETIICTKH